MTFPVENPCGILGCQHEVEDDNFVYVMVAKPSWVFGADTEIEIQVPVCKAHQEAVFYVTRESND